MKGKSGHWIGWAFCLLSLAAPSVAQAQDSNEASSGRPAPERTAGSTLTLPEAQRIALERNPSILATEREVDRSEALIRQSWALLFPGIGASVQYTMADEPTIVNFEIPGASDLFGGSEPIVLRNQHTAQVLLNARQPLFNGRSISMLRTAHDARDLTETTIEQARRQLVLSVARAFYATISASRAVVLIERNMETATEAVEAAQARLEAQAGLAIDVARAELEFESLRSQREMASLAYQNARDGVALLTGMPPTELPELVEPAVIEGEPSEVSELLDRAIDERLDLRAARGQTHLARRNLTATWWTFAPTLDLTWGLSHTLTDLGGFGDRRTQWNLMIAATIPIFDGGLRYGQLRDSRARIAQAELAEEMLEQSAAIEVRQAFRAWRTASETVSISIRRVILAEEAHRLAVAAYEAGAASNLELVEAQRAVTAAQIDRELRALSTQLALIELFASTEVPSSSASMGR